MKKDEKIKMTHFAFNLFKLQISWCFWKIMAIMKRLTLSLYNNNSTYQRRGLNASSVSRAMLQDSIYRHTIHTEPAWQQTQAKC